MSEDILLQKCTEYLDFLCNKTPGRHVGGEGNRLATAFFEKEVKQHGWETETPGFDAMDWEEEGAVLRSGDTWFEVLVSPYSNGYSGEAGLVAVSSAGQLEITDIKSKIVFLYGEIAREQLMPKNFVFYNPEEHQHIIALLEKGEPAAIISATGRNASLAGGVYPFPLIEDGDFDIPSVYMKDSEGEKLLPFSGRKVFLESRSGRIPGKGYNVIARKGGPGGAKIVVTAHIDAKKGTPGAIDNATGVTVLLLLAELLKDYAGSRRIEIVALNGEDYYAVPGQMNYIAANHGKFGEMMLNINIDGAGYREGPTAFSLFGLPGGLETAVRDVIHRFPGLTEGIPWPQGDHSIFVQFGVPAVAVSSNWFIENIGTQEITHTPADHPGIVSYDRLVETARALDFLIRLL